MSFWKFPNIGFWRTLKKCPLCIDVASGEPKNPDNMIWKDPKKPSSWEKGLHPGAVWSMRSIVQNPGNQCIYDAMGDISLDANTHGTADFKEEGTSAHYEHDVEPVILADMLDRGHGGKGMSIIWFIFRGFPYVPGTDAYQVLQTPGPNTKKYIEVRSPW
ncbi:MAG: hypothetical protein EAZ42_06970 [Verrucomicrobia bacterium]|nr:MAG: hypothetical protein EAZ42_06970 [Verrucomicrobiota bacterium]